MKDTRDDALCRQQYPLKRRADQLRVWRQAAAQRYNGWRGIEIEEAREERESPDVQAGRR